MSTRKLDWEKRWLKTNSTNLTKHTDTHTSNYFNIQDCYLNTQKAEDMTKRKLDREQGLLNTNSTNLT